MSARSDLTVMSEAEVATAFARMTGRVPVNLEEARQLYFAQRLRFEYEVLALRGLTLDLTAEKETVS